MNNILYLLLQLLYILDFIYLPRAFHDIRWQDLQLGLLIRLTHPCVQVHCVCILFLLFSLIAKYNLTIRTRAISNPITLLKSANHPYVFYSYGCCNTLYKSDRKSSHPSALHYGQKKSKKVSGFHMDIVSGMYYFFEFQL